MDYNTIFVEMDVHKEKSSHCYYLIEKDEFLYPHTTTGEYRQVLAYLTSLRNKFGENVSFLCSYEAGSYDGFFAPFFCLSFQYHAER